MTEMNETAVRRSNRIFVQVPVEIVLDSTGRTIAYAASTVDLSTLGARVQTQAALVAGQHVSLIWAGAAPRRLRSQVVWSAPKHADRLREAGLRFLEPFQAAA